MAPSGSSAPQGSRRSVAVVGTSMPHLHAGRQCAVNPSPQKFGFIDFYGNSIDAYHAATPDANIMLSSMLWPPCPVQSINDCVPRTIARARRSASSVSGSAV